MIRSAYLMCHAPIVIPEIAGPRAVEVEVSTRSMRRAAEKLVSDRPDRVLVISPHTPRFELAFGVTAGSSLQGSFRDFGVDYEMSLPNDEVNAGQIQKTAKARGVSVLPLPPFELDHGAMVPLYFLIEAGWSGPTLVLSLPYEPTHQECRAIGEAIRDVAGTSEEVWSIIASGDMSHRLIEDAPAGFDPRAKEFDRHVEKHLKKGSLQAAVDVDPELRKLAAEDVIDSLEIATSAVDSDSTGYEFLSYEGPFGVGYLIAALHRNEVSISMTELAREAISSHFQGKDFGDSAYSKGGPVPKPAFVTLFKDGALRGCIGHTRAVGKSLYEEVWCSAVAAATQDPRFPPLEKEELESLKIEVSLLEPAERVESISELDPARFGVIVQKEGATGLLLPGIEGISTVEDQLSIVFQKAGITNPDGAKILKFRVSKEAED